MEKKIVMNQMIRLDERPSKNKEAHIHENTVTNEHITRKVTANKLFIRRHFVCSYKYTFFLLVPVVRPVIFYVNLFKHK